MPTFSPEATLNIARVSCPASELASEVFDPIAQSSLGKGDDTASSCGGAGQEDRAYHWVVPNDGLFIFRATGDTFRAIVSVLDGPRCSAPELGCNAASLAQYPADVARQLVAGQELTVLVDGVDGAGAFTLEILESVAACPERVEPAGDIVSESFTARVLSPSCAEATVTGLGGTPYSRPDVSFLVTVPGAKASCMSSCTFSILADDDFVAYVLDQGDCGGREVACVSSPGMKITIALGNEGNMEDTQYTLVIMDTGPFGSSQYSLAKSCGVACF